MSNKPVVELTDSDANAFAILAKCRSAAKSAKWPPEAWEAVFREMTGGDYAHLLQTAIKHFEVR